MKLKIELDFPEIKSKQETEAMEQATVNAFAVIAQNLQKNIENRNSGEGMMGTKYCPVIDGAGYLKMFYKNPLPGTWTFVLD